MKKETRAQGMPWRSWEWQEKERLANEDIKAGRISGPFKGVETLREHVE